jgi:hypothetical protein
MAVERRTVDLSAYPDLVMLLLGMRVNAITGLKTLFNIGSPIEASARAKPDGLLHHEIFLFSLFPPHIGIREYWRDFESLETYSRSEPHRTWWTDFLRNSGGTGFWHETYRMKGGIEAVFDDVPVPLGLGTFAPLIPARGGMFSARRRLESVAAADLPVTPEPAAVVGEDELSTS